MSPRDSEEEQVRFQDVAICFSEEEWKVLQEWQKDFYKNVMNEIHQALLLLGYQIVNAGTWLRIYKDKDAPLRDPQTAERAAPPDSLSSPAAVTPDILFRITSVEETDCGSQSRPKEIGLRNSCFPVVTAAFSLTPEEELELYPAEASSSAPERVVSPEVVLVNSNGDEKLYIADDQDCEIIESMSDTAGDRSMNIQQRVGVTTHCTKTTAIYRPTSEDKTVYAFKSSHKGPNFINQHRLESYQKINGEKRTECESGFSHTKYFSVNQEKAKERIFPKFNEHVSDLWHSPFLRGNIKEHQPLYTCNECDKSFSLKSELSKHVETHPAEITYAILDYEEDLVQNAHANEKPFPCTICHKSFSRKDYLCGHIRTHTGERPHICADCGKNFTWRSHLTRHRKNKHCKH
ncbi:hypothetical protein NDU88_000235 [Pleurodeles waltl]|uniref:Uncharacterized protein n=1 Tax=Pleurodeles waltl TaxID=8319 RepID=A0AAV7P0A4_PLEWA|nr:hypothetical protein NDU88_000235 [Pleurodeles waltl]